MVGVLVKCSKCGKHVEASTIIIGKNKVITCRNCNSQSNPAQDNKPKIPPKEKYECVDCGYKFSRTSESRLASRCPYCSSLRVRPYVGRTANDLLNEIDEV
ncbi:hypothetical protein J4403_02730 [Candidatus Woesearchaeota archaeon]|nr:hypothetical protein [Candidatus Woesearchaeota archaeon]